ncbi:reverse transcriptase domain-containing protein [Pedobacter sp. WC2423]|uniref:reverse transcriptase domain-containing protein n=1 Tax=Pedobacter sp. WC2423 TaxID=3234142 RepID=UPI00346692F8
MQPNLTTNNTEYLLSKIAVRITVKFKESILVTTNTGGSGVIYFTSADCNYLYVFTALHCIFGQREVIENKNVYHHAISDIDYVLVEHNENLATSSFRAQKVTAQDIFIHPKRDFCILKVDKKLIANRTGFPEIVLHSNKRDSGSFRSAGFPNSNRDIYSPLTYTFSSSSPDGIIVIRSEGTIHSDGAIDLISGYSGSGLLLSKGPVLVGIITKLADESALANNIHALDLSFVDINKILLEVDENLEEVNYTNNAKKIIVDEQENLIDLSRIEVNGVHLDIWKAVGNIKSDINDDWFQDPVRFADMLYSGTIYQIIQDNIVDGSYVPQAPEIYTVPKEGFTTRRAVQNSIIDRVIYQAVTDVIAQELDHILINTVYSARYNYDKSSNHTYFFNNSVEQWQKFQHQILESINIESPYLVVTDITNYYDNISLAALKTKLDDHISDVKNPAEYRNAITLLTQLIAKWQSNMGYTSNGIPQNRDASAFIANLFMAHIDRQMVGEFPNYYRFMDDIRIVCEDKYQARKALMSLIDKLSEIGLNLNSQKTNVLNWSDPEERKKIEEYTPITDRQIDQICTLNNSNKPRELQIAVGMVNDLFHYSVEHYQELGSPKKFRFSIERLQRFARTPGFRDLINFSDIVSAIAKWFEDSPWHAETYIRFLMAIDKDYITKSLLDVLITSITDPGKNIYTWQSYSIFKLLAYHKITDPALLLYAEKLITNSQGTEKAPEVAGACIYFAALSPGAVSIIKRSFNKGFFNTYISQRSALLCLESVPQINLTAELDRGLKTVHQNAYVAFLTTGKKSDLVSGPGEIKLKDIPRDLPLFVSL